MLLEVCTNVVLVVLGFGPDLSQLIQLGKGEIVAEILVKHEVLLCLHQILLQSLIKGGVVQIRDKGATTACEVVDSIGMELSEVDFLLKASGHDAEHACGLALLGGDVLEFPQVVLLREEGVVVEGVLVGLLLGLPWLGGLGILHTQVASGCASYNSIAFAHSGGREKHDLLIGFIVVAAELLLHLDLLL